MKRFNHSRRCPICNGYDGAERGTGKRCFGFLSDDEEWAHCTREEYAGSLEKNESSNTYAHKLVGDCKCGKRHDSSPVKQIVAIYDYFDESGELLYQCVRYEPKDFRQRRPDSKGGWIWDLKGVRRVLYRLPQLLDADVSETVFIVEGEKCADKLAAIGLVATTNPSGAEKWRSEYNEHLRGRHVVILPDNDEAGRKHAEKVAASLHGIVASVFVVTLPDLPEKGDVSNWLDAGGTVEQLQTIVAETNIYALLDRSAVVQRVHLEAAKAVWDYCDASARYIFGGNKLSAKAQKLLNWLHEAGDAGLDKSQIYAKFGKHIKQDELDALLKELKDAELAYPEIVATGGRDKERWYAVREKEVRSSESDEFDEESLILSDDLISSKTSICESVVEKTDKQ